MSTRVNLSIKLSVRLPAAVCHLSSSPFFQISFTYEQVKTMIGRPVVCLVTSIPHFMMNFKWFFCWCFTLALAKQASGGRVSSRPQQTVLHSGRIASLCIVGAPVKRKSSMTNTHIWTVRHPFILSTKKSVRAPFRTCTIKYTTERKNKEISFMEEKPTVSKSFYSPLCLHFD